MGPLPLSKKNKTFSVGYNAVVLLNVLVLTTLLSIVPPVSSNPICPRILPDVPPTATQSTRPHRVVNGDLAQEFKYYMASVTLQSGTLLCSATLLSEYWALTAAHCPLFAGIHVLRLGGDTVSSGVTREIEKAIPHEKYIKGHSSLQAHDIQLVKLRHPAPPGTKYVKINAEASIPDNFSFVRTAGYGSTFGTAVPDSGILRDVDVPVQPTDVCQKQYGSHRWNIVKRHHLCAGYVQGGCDACFGDSGGPLFLFDGEMNVVQVGIVSFGVECALADISGVYARVSSYTTWMREKGALFDVSTTGVNVFDRREEGISSPEATSAPEVGSLFSGDGTGANQGQWDNYNTGAHGECFPGTAVVILDDGSEKKMEDVVVGDRVHVGLGHYSEVLMFTHRVRNVGKRFVRISIRDASGHLLLTPGHLLWLNGHLKAANVARVGDFITMGNGSHVAISSVSTTIEYGLYNPQTLDGNIVVNNVIASTYTTALRFATAHALIAPLRYMFHLNGMRDVTSGAFEKGFRPLYIFGELCNLFCRTTASAIENCRPKQQGIVA